MNTEIVDDEDEEASSVSSHRMFEQKTGTMSSTMLIGKRNLNLYMESQALRVNLPSPETENDETAGLACLCADTDPDFRRIGVNHCWHWSDWCC